MKRPLWRSGEPDFGRRSIGLAGGLLVALVGIGWGAGRAAAGYPRSGWWPGRSPSTTTHFAAHHPLRGYPPSLRGVPVASSLSPLGCAPSPSTPDELYTRRIRPLLAKNCYSCHGGARTSGLDLRTRDGMLRGGSRGPALVPGNPEASLLYRYVAGLEKPSMPPDDRLAAGKVAALKTWIAAGAPTAGGSG